MHIPDQRIRDALLNLIVYQGDTEFASVEQQRALLQNAPSDYDLFALMRVMSEEMRHGWQMSYLLCQHFGDEGKREAQKLLERRAEEGQRLLGSFNEIVENWLDFFTYTQFIDRDGKFQLKMLSTSAFHPLARSMGPMLKEESFHLGTGNNGLLRIVKAGKIPPEIMQRYFNKWIPTAFDLFGTDNSSSAHWAYVWGLKGRFNERETGDPGRRGAPQRGEPGTVPAGDLPAGEPAQPRRFRTGSGTSTCRSSSSTGRSACYARKRFDVKGEEMSRRGLPGLPRVGDSDRPRTGPCCARSSRRTTGSSPRRRRRTEGHRAPGRLGHANTRTLPRPFGAAVELGADAVELDIHASRDGELVVHHDPRIPAVGLIAETDWAAIARQRLPNGEPIPPLAEALRLLEEHRRLDRGEDPAARLGRRGCSTPWHRARRPTATPFTASTTGSSLRLGRAPPEPPRGACCSASYVLDPVTMLEAAGRDDPVAGMPSDRPGPGSGPAPPKPRGHRLDRE